MPPFIWFCQKYWFHGTTRPAPLRWHSNPCWSTFAAMRKNRREVRGEARFAAEAVVCIGQTGLNALATIRSLGRRGVKVIGVSIEGSEQYASASRYCASNLVLPRASALPDAVRELGASRAVRPVLFIDNDNSLRLLSPHADELERLFHVVDPLREALQLTDKGHQLAVARQCGIDVPRTWYPRDWRDLAAIGEATSMRLLAKPVASALVSPFKALVAPSADALLRQLQSAGVEPREVIVQEYVEGGDGDIYAGFAYRTQTGAQHLFSARKLRQTPAGAGVMAVGAPADVPAVRDMTARLAEALGLRGVLSTEFKLDRRSGKFFFIEWNPRPAGFQSLGWRCGFDLAWLAYCDRAGLPCAPPRVHYDSGHHWINVHCELANFIDLPASMLAPATWRPYLMRKEWAVFTPDDPAPWLKSVRQLGAWIFAGTRRRLSYGYFRRTQRTPPAGSGTSPS